jgi:hypothetical protein
MRSIAKILPLKTFYDAQRLCVLQVNSCISFYTSVFLLTRENKILDIMSLFVKFKSLCRRNIVGNKGILQVTFVEALDQLMPGFDPEISKLAQRVLINPRNIDYHTGVFASKVTKSGSFSTKFVFG